jgi:hypothetical protein
MKFITDSFFGRQESWWNQVVKVESYSTIIAGSMCQIGVGSYDRDKRVPKSQLIDLSSPNNIQRPHHVKGKKVQTLMFSS